MSTSCSDATRRSSDSTRRSGNSKNDSSESDETNESNSNNQQNKDTTDSNSQIHFFRRGLIDYNEAVDSEDNLVARHRELGSWTDFTTRLLADVPALEKLVAWHTGRAPGCVRIGRVETWAYGSFNLAFPMQLLDVKNENDDTESRVILRFPIPATTGEFYYPGSMQEKLRCEVASYIYMQRHCSDVRIPFLYGFGFPDGTNFIHRTLAPFFQRLALRLRQAVAYVLRRPIPSDYLRIPSPVDLPPNTGYMVLEYLGPTLGQQIPAVVHNHLDLVANPTKTRNLLRSLASIMLSLARLPQPRIGAFAFRYDGTIALENRPVTMNMIQQENEGAPRTMAETTTYTTIDSYITDLAAFHDQRFRCAPNAVTDAADSRSQMAVQALLRTVTPAFLDPRFRNGPFALYLSDTNAANFLIDDDWHVTAMFDLEWIISAPVDFPRTPVWLTWDSIDTVAGDGYDDFTAMFAQFVDALRFVEDRNGPSALERASGARLCQIEQDNLSSRRYWFYKALLSTNGMYFITPSQITPMFYKDKLPYNHLYQMWSPDADRVVKQKVADREAYLEEINRIFGRSASPLDLNCCSAP